MTTATATTTLSTRAGFTVAAVEGEIDISNSVELETELSHAVPNDASHRRYGICSVRHVPPSFPAIAALPPTARARSLMLAMP